MVEAGWGWHVWNSMTYDEELGQGYLDNGDPGSTNCGANPKDNLFLARSSRWIRRIPSLQVKPGERWDYKAWIWCSKSADGQPRKALMGADQRVFLCD